MSLYSERPYFWTIFNDPEIEELKVPITLLFLAYRNSFLRTSYFERENITKCLNLFENVRKG